MKKEVKDIKVLGCSTVLKKKKKNTHKSPIIIKLGNTKPVSAPPPPPSSPPPTPPPSSPPGTKDWPANTLYLVPVVNRRDTRIGTHTELRGESEGHQA